MKTAPLNTRIFAVLHEVMFPEDDFLNLFFCEWRSLFRRDF